MRSIFTCALLTVALLFASAASADAQVISRYNPYRSFNVSGVNYGSLQWEKQNRRSWSSNRMTKPQFQYRRWR